jgi:hypothetical protein
MDRLSDQERDRIAELIAQGVSPKRRRRPFPFASTKTPCR